MSKRCNYCHNVKKWKGYGHLERDCKTKQRETGGGNAPAAKPAKLDLDDIDEGVPPLTNNRLFVRMVKINNLTTSSRNGWYEYDTGAQVHTTNEKHRLINPRPCNTGIQGHDGHSTQAELIGDIELPHNGQVVVLRNVLYHPTFSNLVSGLRSTNKTCTLTQKDKKKAILEIANKLVYQMEVDKYGLWIKPDDITKTLKITLKVNSTKAPRAP